MSAPRAAAVVFVAVCACARAAGAESFRDQFRGPTQALGTALAETVARAVPVLSGSPGITFTYDPSSGGFTRNTDLVGQIYLERAQPIGRRKWNAALSYQRIALDEIQGQDAAEFRDDTEAIVVGGGRQQDPPVPGAIPIKYFRYDVGLTVHQLTLAATYGITDDLDVNLTLPILVSALSIESNGRAFKVDPNENRLIPLPATVGASLFGDSSSNATGVGDLLLRGKYRFLTRPAGELAAGLVLRMPTGNQDDFQGTGAWELSPLLYATTRRLPVAGRVAAQFFLNGGLDVNVDDVDLSQGRFGVGADLALGTVTTLSLAFLGRQPFHGFAPAGSFDVPRYRPSNNTCRADSTRGCPLTPLFGLDTARPSYYWLAIGGRANLWRDTVFGFTNVLIPLNDRGIKTEPIPLVGFEATF